MIRRPIIILGSVRSGTTLLGKVLAHHPEVAYWEEPKHIWRHRHAYRAHDRLTDSDVTPAICKYIHTQFDSYRRAQNKPRFMEKTPSNCLRVPFIRKIFPDALFIHMIRDGRASATSARVQWRNDFIVQNDLATEKGRTNSSFTEVDQNRGIIRRIFETAFKTKKFLVEKRRLSGGIWTFIEAPAYLPALGRMVARTLTKDNSYVWGTRFPGIDAAHRTYSLIEVCAMQWAISVQQTRLDTANLPSSQLLELHYEQFLADPVDHLQRIQAFCQLPINESVLRFASERIRPDEARWRQILTKEEKEILNHWIGPLLESLGYDAA